MSVRVLAILMLLPAVIGVGVSAWADEPSAASDGLGLESQSVTRLPPVEATPPGGISPDSLLSDEGKINTGEQADGDDGSADEAPSGSPMTLSPGPWSWRSWRERFRMGKWKGSAELGLDGSAGNSDTFNIRLGASAKRKTKANKFVFEIDYHKNTNDGEETANRLYFDSRWERPLPRKPWFSFLQNTTVYDEFQPWNIRVNVAGGLGYDFIDDDVTTLQLRWGGGGSQEIGGSEQDWVPELTSAVEFEHQLSKRQKIKASSEYYPDVTSFGDYRVITKCSWEVLLDEEMDLSLKLSAADRFKRPNPGGKLNDLDYAIVLLWKY